MGSGRRGDLRGRQRHVPAVAVPHQYCPAVSQHSEQVRHLGIDPEFSMRKSGKKPGSVIGTFDAADINWTSEYLAKLVKAYRAAGVKLTEALDEGSHFHIAWAAGKAVTEAAKEADKVAKWLEEQRLKAQGKDVIELQIGELRLNAGGLHLGRKDVLHGRITTVDGALIFLRGAALGLALPFLASAYPVWRAVRVTPVEAFGQPQQ